MRWYISFPKDFVSVFWHSMLKIYYSVYIMLQYFYLFGNEIAYIIYLTYVCIIVHSLYRTIILKSMHQSLLFCIFPFWSQTAKFCCRKDKTRQQKNNIASAVTFVYLSGWCATDLLFPSLLSVFVIRSSISWCVCVRVCIFFIIIFVFSLFRVHPVNFKFSIFVFFFISFCYLDRQQRLRSLQSQLRQLPTKG